MFFWWFLVSTGLVETFGLFFPRSSNGEEISNLNQYQKTKICSKVSRDGKPLDEQKSGNTYKKVHYKYIHSQQGSQGSIILKAAWQAPTPRDTRSASVSRFYDAQEESEQVLQGGTEAIFKVSHYDINEQRANFDTLHEKPDPLPSKPSLPVPAVHGHEDQNQPEDRKAPQDAEDLTSQWDSSTQASVMEHQTTPSEGSPANQINPATSTSPIDLGFPKQRNWCSRETLSRNLFQHCPTDHNLEKSNFGQPIPIKPGPKDDLLKTLSKNYERGPQGEHLQLKSDRRKSSDDTNLQQHKPTTTTTTTDYNLEKTNFGQLNSIPIKPGPKDDLLKL